MAAAGKGPMTESAACSFVRPGIPVLLLRNEGERAMVCWVANYLISTKGITVTLLNTLPNRLHWIFHWLEKKSLALRFFSSQSCLGFPYSRITRI